MTMKKSREGTKRNTGKKDGMKTAKRKSVNTQQTLKNDSDLKKSRESTNKNTAKKDGMKTAKVKQKIHKRL